MINQLSYCIYQDSVSNIHICLICLMFSIKTDECCRAEETINHNQEWHRFEPLPLSNNTNSIQPSVKSVKICCAKQLTANNQTIVIRGKGRKSTLSQIPQIHKTWNTWKLLWQLVGTMAYQFFHWIYPFISFYCPVPLII